MFSIRYANMPPMSITKFHSLVQEWFSKKFGVSTGLITLSACDPLNLIGILTPDDKIAAVIGNKICFRDGVAICSLSHGQITNYVSEKDPDLIKAQIFLGHHQKPYTKPPVELLASQIKN